MLIPSPSAMGTIRAFIRSTCCTNWARRLNNAMNKGRNSSNNLARALRLMVYLVLVCIAIYQLSQKAREAPVVKPQADRSMPPHVNYVPAEKQEPALPVEESEKPVDESTFFPSAKSTARPSPRGPIRTK